MLIDAHHHLWDLSRGYAWLEDPSLGPIRRTFTVEDLRLELSAAGVDRTILVEAAREDRSEVDDFLALAESTDFIAGVVGWCDLTDPQLPEHPLLVGARSQVQGQPDPDYLTRPDVLAGLRRIADAGLAYDLIVRVDQLPAAAAAAAALPDLTLVLDHLGKPAIREGAAGLAAWREAITPLAARPNVAAKLSGLVTEADWANWQAVDLLPFVQTALELFGPRRLMFGSDWPVCLLAASYLDVMGALDVCLGSLTQAERAAIYGVTAARVYRVNP